MTPEPPEAPTDERSPSEAGSDPAYYEALGRAIKVARTQLGLDRKDLAQLANVSYAYLSDIETGRGRPGSRSLFSIAASLGRTPAELMGEAEVYRERITGGPLTLASRISSGGDASDELPLAAIRATSPTSTRELRKAWSERLETSESTARAELHAIIDRLSREDLAMALMLARRLLAPGPEDR